MKIELIESIAIKIGKWACPSKIIICQNLPKTRSGKIFRRILRKLSNGETEFGDISTLADSSAVTEVIKKYNQSS